MRLYYFEDGSYHLVLCLVFIRLSFKNPRYVFSVVYD